MSAKYKEALAQVEAIRKAMRCSVSEAKASVHTDFSRILQSLRNREIFLLNHIDVVRQSLEDLLAEQEQQLISNLRSSDSTCGISDKENGDDLLANELAGCTVSFDADVSALRDAIQHFGRVTTSQSLQVDVPYTHSNRTDDQQQSPVLADADDSAHSQDEFVLVNDYCHFSDGEWVDPGAVLTAGSQQYHDNVDLDNGITVFPEVGVYVTVNEATGQCHVSYELATDNDNASQIDLEKVELVDCFETSDADDMSDAVDAAYISPLTGYVRKITMQPVELWLACTRVYAVENELVSEGLLPEVEEAPVVNGFVRYVESVSVEPLEYWLCSDCDIQFPSTDRDSIEHVVAEDASRAWPEPEADVASVTAGIHRVLCQPDSFWVVGDHSVGRMSDTGTELNLSFRLPLCQPSALSYDPANVSYVWPSHSSTAVTSDHTEVIINDANGTSVGFEFRSIDLGSTVGKDANFALLSSKPVGYWLYSGSQKITVFD